jgi:RNA-directed DNA polymerase
LATTRTRSLLLLTQGYLAGSARAVAQRNERRRVMTRQKSEDRDKPQGRRKPVVTREDEPRAGGEAIPVDEASKQLLLFAGTADTPAPAGGRGGAARSRERAEPHVAPKPVTRGEMTTTATMDEVTQRLGEAFQKVERNRGAPGPDGKTLKVMRKHLSEWLPLLQTALLTGTYMPGDIRRVWIPKGGGGERGLGIPNVIDRVVQEAVRQVLEPLYEPTFHASSHGFRPGRSCHTAIAEAVKHVEEGHEWVVDLDLEKFFDRVNHQRLMSKLAERVTDKSLLVLIGRMLKAKVVLPDGVVVPNEEGVPQGGPLSPLLSNIVLDELDRELDRRGHRFVRYADDCNVYVRSERAGHRVMASLKQFIERRLRLKVNEQKSAVALPEERHFVGFRLRREPLSGVVEVLLSKRSKERIGEKLRSLVPRNFGNSLDACIRQLNGYLLGWICFFVICTSEERTFQSLDAHIRRRLRALQLHHWKQRRTIARQLVKLGISGHWSRLSVYGGRKSTWALSHTSAVDRALRNSYWDARGLFSIARHWQSMREHIAAPVQLTLALG